MSNPIDPSIDLRAYALVGARLELHTLAAERDRILALFPQLDARPTPTPARPAPQQHAQTCIECGRGFTPSSSNQILCGRAACAKARKSAYMREYWAKRAAARQAS